MPANLLENGCPNYEKRRNMGLYQLIFTLYFEKPGVKSSAQSFAFFPGVPLDWKVITIVSTLLPPLWARAAAMALERKQNGRPGTC